MDKFLQTYNLLKLTQEEIENLNRLIAIKDIQSVIKSFPTKKNSRLVGLTSEFYQTSKEDLTKFFLKFSEKQKKREHFLNHFYEISTTLIPKADKDIIRKGTCTAISLMDIYANIFNKMLEN